jgi:hypothetical protein
MAKELPLGAAPVRVRVIGDAASAVTVLGNHDRWLLEGVRLEDLDPATVPHPSSRRLEANDDLQALLRGGTTRLVLKGHRHRHAIWRIGGMTPVDAGPTSSPSAPCAVVVDVDAATITPLQVADGAAVALTPHPLRN